MLNRHHVRAALAITTGLTLLVTLGTQVTAATPTAPPSPPPWANASGNNVDLTVRRVERTYQDREAPAADHSDAADVRETHSPTTPDPGEESDPCHPAMVTMTSAMVCEAWKLQQETASSPQGRAEALATTVITSLHLPEPIINIGPDPSWNEWNMAVVGYPLWLWTTEADTRATHSTIAGQPIDLHAHRTQVSFDMGDGSAPVTCTATDPYIRDAVPAAAPAPRCGHTYLTRNEPGTNYTITATATWTVDWTALGYAGTIVVHTTTTRTVHVGELQSIVVAAGR